MKLHLPCIVTSNMFALQQSIFVLSDFTPDVVHSGLVDSLVMSFRGSISIVLGWAMSAPAWFAKSSPCGLHSSFFGGFPSFFFFGGLLGGDVFSGPIAPPLRFLFVVSFLFQICRGDLHTEFHPTAVLLLLQGNLCVFFSICVSCVYLRIF